MFDAVVATLPAADHGTWAKALYREKRFLEPSQEETDGSARYPPGDTIELVAATAILRLESRG